ncbi:zinc-ribbon domain-containing protein [Lactococcus lactis]|uniref:zinc-ribbon domain-containing protein n=1 Tax=Lactococcus lactis TaxID=1358 RepID=UPI001294060C|nr:zinc-ribbon domain-containing protein [Lactococcus lactis]MQQ80261.1 zinc-ribbon domain-containing protein [Lactococcus lactis]
MKKVICENCGTKNKTNSEFCSKCGTKLPEQSKIENNDINNKSNSNMKIIYIISGLLIIISGITGSVIAKKLTHANNLKMVNSLGITLENAQKQIDSLNDKKSSISSEIKSQTNQLEDLKKQVTNETKKVPTYQNVKGGLLSAGVYTVGSDLKEGVYTFKYTATASKRDYWSNDYLYITNAGSQGKEETLGGTKYDLRFGGYDYDSASKGMTGHVTLKKGDVISVESSYGNWTY